MGKHRSKQNHCARTWRIRQTYCQWIRNLWDFSILWWRWRCSNRYEHSQCKIFIKIRTYRVMDRLQFHLRAITSFMSFLIVLKLKKALRIKTPPPLEIWLKFRMQIKKLRLNMNLLLILTLYWNSKTIKTLEKR